jgi:hypothetical protein
MHCRPLQNKQRGVRGSSEQGSRTVSVWWVRVSRGQHTCCGFELMQGMPTGAALLGACVAGGALTSCLDDPCCVNAVAILQGRQVQWCRCGARHATLQSTTLLLCGHSWHFMAFKAFKAFMAAP